MTNLTIDQFDTLVLNADCAVVKYWADWCVNCHEIDPTVHEVAEESTIPFYAVDIENEPELKAKAGIKAIPAILFYKNGRVREFLFGKITKEKIQQKLRMIQR